MDAIQEHEQKLLAAFVAVLASEDKLSDVKRRLHEATTLLEQERTGAETKLEQAWVEVEKLMAETGEPEVFLLGEVTDFKIGWSSPRQTVKVEADAVPDEFCKIERKPKLKEIGDYLKRLKEEGAALPNWGRFEDGATKLTWKAVKKSA
jgi:hypothetical protein